MKRIIMVEKIEDIEIREYTDHERKLLKQYERKNKIKKYDEKNKLIKIVETPIIKDKSCIANHD